MKKPLFERITAHPPTWPTVVASTSLAVSLLSLFYTARTFALNHRPYVGVIEQAYQLVGDPPTAMVWRFVLKNVGTLPTWVTVSENCTVITRADGTFRTLPMLGEPSGGIYLMPNQTADLTGEFSDAGGNARVDDVFSGRTRLEVHIRLDYGAAGVLGTSSYRYSSVELFRVSPMPPAFIMVSAGGT